MSDPKTPSMMSPDLLTYDMPKIPEQAQKMRDAGAALLRVAADEKFVVVGVAFRPDGAIISLQNTKDDLPELMRAAADMLEERFKNGKVIRDSVRRLN